MPRFDTGRWDAVSPLLDRALELTDAERAAWLASLRQRQPTTAADLQALLDEHRALAGDSFLEAPLPPVGAICPGQRLGAYTIVSALGEGGMGTVWLADRSDGRFARCVAIKFPRLSLAAIGEARFRREGSILGRLAHPNIAQLVDAGVTPDGQPYLVLEYVEGEPIDRYAERRRLDEAARVRLILEVLSAVAHAHANLIVHRDLKPSNVLVAGDGRVKLLDFGIAKLLEPEGGEAATLLTRDGAAALTPAYAAPEQLTGGVVTTATDVYAIGVLLYSLLTGRHPAGSDLGSPAALMKSIVDGEPPPAARGDLDTIVRKALKKSAAERYPSATALADDLERYLRHEPIGARPDSIAYRAGKFVRRNRAAVALAGLALAAAAAGVAGTSIQARTARNQRDFALRELARADSINDLNAFLLSDAAPSGERFTVDDLLTRAEHIVRRQQGDAASRAELLGAIGRQYTVEDEYGKARALLEQAYALASTTGAPAARARAACGLAQVLASGSELQRAEALLDEGLRELPPDPTFAGDRLDCLLRGSEIAVRAGAAAQAVARADAARALARQLPVRSELSELDALITSASAYSAGGRHREAADAFNEAFTRLAALGRDDTQRAATILNNWATALYLAGRPLDAEAIYRRAMGIAEDGNGDAAVAPMLLVNYARALQELGRSSRASDYADRGYAKARAAGADVVVNQALLLRASIYRSLGRIDDAEAALAEAAPWVTRVLPPGHVGRASFANQEALVAVSRGDLPDALARENEAVAIAETSMAARGQGKEYVQMCLAHRSEIELEMSQTAKAEADARRAIALADATDAPSMHTGRAHLALGLALKAANRPREARAEFQQAFDELSRAGGATQPDAVRARQLAGR